MVDGKRVRGLFFLLLIAIAFIAISSQEVAAPCRWGNRDTNGDTYCMNVACWGGAYKECMSDAECNDGDAATRDECMPAIGTACCNYYGNIYGICDYQTQCKHFPISDPPCPDGCWTGSQCLPSKVGASCNDGDPCTVGETYEDACGAVCSGGTSPPTNCAGASTVTCGESYVDACNNQCGKGTKCGTPICGNPGSCNTATGACAYECWGGWDGSGYTVNDCLGPTECQTGPELNGNTCLNINKVEGTLCSDDGNPCTSNMCDGNGACAHPPVINGPAAGGGYCNNGQWVSCITAAHCPDDGNPCTEEKCIGGGAPNSFCKSDPNNALSCAPGTCSNGNCIRCYDSTDCNDGNSCTDDVCYNAGTQFSSCSNPAVDTTCADSATVACGQTITPVPDCGSCLSGTLCASPKSCNGASCICPAGTTPSGAGCVETACADGLDNDANTKYDYDGWSNGKTGAYRTSDPNCKVCINSASISGGTSANTVRSGSSFTLTCASSAASIRSVNPVFPAGSCTFTGWSGSNAIFSCTASNVAATTSASIGCQIDTSISTLTAGCTNPRTITITINPSDAGNCGSVTQPNCGAPNTPQCVWYPMCQAGTGPKSSGIAGYCTAATNPAPAYACRGTTGALQCGAGCSPDTVCYAGNGNCNLGTCACQCNAGTPTFCGGNCVNTQTNSSNCGVCGNVCPGVKVCSAGSCVCPPGTDPTTCAETACTNSVDDDKNGKTDYAGPGCVLGDPNCKVSLTDMAAPANVYAGQQFIVSCRANVGVCSVGAKIGTTNCPMNASKGWYGAGNTWADYICPPFGIPGTQTATCFVNPASSAQSGGNITRSVTAACAPGTAWNGSVCVTCDADGDTYSNKSYAAICPGPATDCHDFNAAVKPGAAEVCTDGLDNNCNGEADYDGFTSGLISPAVHGDIDCKVKVIGAAVDDPWCSLGVFPANCTYNVGNIRSARAEIIMGSTVQCTHAPPWGGKNGTFNCPVSALGSGTVRCSVDTSKSYQDGGNMSAPVQVNAVSQECGTNGVCGASGACIPCDADSDGYNNRTLAGCKAPATDCVDNPFGIDGVPGMDINPGSPKICGNTVDEDCSGCVSKCNVTWTGYLKNDDGIGVAGTVRTDDGERRSSNPETGAFTVYDVDIGNRTFSGNTSNYDYARETRDLNGCINPVLLNLTLRPAECADDCTYQGLCSYNACIGKSSCSTGTLNATEREIIKRECEWKEPGSVVQLNSTHSYPCCGNGKAISTSAVKNPVSIQGCSENLITLSRTVNYQGRIMTLEIITYNKCE